MRSLNEYRALVAVVESGSIRGAAEDSELPRSTISRSIRRLEERLEVQLFERGGVSMAPTEAGRLLYERARDFLRDIAASESQVQRLSGRRDSLVVSAPRTSDVPQVRDLLVGFSSEYPEVGLQVLATDRYVDLEADGVDVAIRAGRQGPTRSIARRIASGRWRLRASPAWVEEHGRPAEVASLWDHPLIVRQNEAGELIWPFAVPIAEEARIRLRVTDFATMRAAVSQDLGIAAYPDVRQSPETVCVLPDAFDVEAELCVFFRREDRDDERVRAFVEFAADALELDPSADVG